MVTPERGSITLASSAGTRSIDLYASDVVGALCTLSTYGAAGTASDTFYIAQANGIISDFSITTGWTATTGISVLINGVPTGNILNGVIHVSTNANRPKLAISLNRGDKLQFVQI